MRILNMSGRLLSERDRYRADPYYSLRKICLTVWEILRDSDPRLQDRSPEELRYIVGERRIIVRLPGVTYSWDLPLSEVMSVLYHEEDCNGY